MWHSGAKRVIIPGATVGTFIGGCRPKVVWHTTEGGLGGLEATYRASGSIPHFTIAHVDGKRVLWQHVDTAHSVSALEHPRGTPDTNRALAYQVEIVGFAAESGGWGDSRYHYLNLLAQWFHRHHKVPMTTDVKWRHPTRIGAQSFLTYSGHCGHVHVPNNRHTDPGTGFHIGKVLNPKG